jgi:hypothetical protein
MIVLVAKEPEHIPHNANQEAAEEDQLRAREYLN